MALLVFSTEDKRKVDAMYQDFMSRTPGGQGRPGGINPANDPQEEWFRITSNDGGGAYTVQRQIWVAATGWSDDTTDDYTAYDYRLSPTGFPGQIVKGWRAYDSTGNWRLLIDTLGYGAATSLVKIIDHTDRDNANTYNIQLCHRDGTVLAGSSISSGIANLRETGIAVLTIDSLIQGFLHIDGTFYLDHHAGYLFRAEITDASGGAVDLDLKILNAAGNIPAGAVALTGFACNQPMVNKALFLENLDIVTGIFSDISAAVPGLTWTPAGAVLADYEPGNGDKVWALVRPAPYGDRWIIQTDHYDLGNY